MMTAGDQTGLYESDRGFYREWRTPGADRVRCRWEQFVPADSAGLVQRVIPDGCADLIVFATGQAIVVGPTMQVANVDLPAGSHARGLRLRTAALASVLGPAGRDLRDRTLPLDNLLSDAGARSVMNAIWGGRTPQSLPLSQALDRRVEYAVHSILHNSYGTIAEIADDLGMSPKHLHRLLVHNTGLAPSSLRRVGRLHRFLARAEGAHQPISLARLAAESGYSDHAHLTHEVQALTHCSPTVLLYERRQAALAYGTI